MSFSAQIVGARLWDHGRNRQSATEPDKAVCGKVLRVFWLAWLTMLPAVCSLGQDCEPEWLQGSGLPGLDGPVQAMIYFDSDAEGPEPPRLIAGGLFNTAVDQQASFIAQWDGLRWSPLAEGVDGEILSFVVFDDGTGPALYAGGALTTAGGVTVNGIARWDGSEWSPLSGPSGTGVSGLVRALTVFDDGSGPALYAGGSFTTAGGVTVNRLARWNGSEWSPLTDAGGTGVNGRVDTLTAFDDGFGPALYAGGNFTTAGGETVNQIARWDGSSWSPLSGPGGTGVNGMVRALTVFDDGAGPALHVGGNFSTAGGVTVNRIARWNGSSWSPLTDSGATGVSGTVEAMTVFNDGSGPDLYVGGAFVTAGQITVNRIARWDGQSWSSLPGATQTGVTASVLDLLGIDGTVGPAVLYVGGNFNFAGGESARSIAAWSDNEWSSLRGEMLSSIDFPANAFAIVDDLSGPVVYVGGSFATAGGVTVNRIARWDGLAWTPLIGPGGTGVNATVFALAQFDDGTGPALYAGGEFSTAGGVTANNIARWDGSAWSPLTGPSEIGVDNRVRALTVFDDGTGPALYAGGEFSTAGGVTANNIARWDGSAWSPLTGPSEIGVDNRVRALTVFDDGTGPALYAGGEFSTAGGVTVNNIARWDGSAWSPLIGPSGIGVNSLVRALTVFDDGSGPALYAGGNFSTAGGVTVYQIARWDSSSWSALTGPGGTGLEPFAVARALTVFDDGTGPALYVGGNFTTAGGVTVNGIARWNGSEWSPLNGLGGTGVSDALETMTVFDDGSGPALYVAGGFVTAGGVTVNRIARWDGAAWSALTSPDGTGVNGFVNALTVFDPDGPTGPSASRLIAGGSFTQAGGLVSSYFAQYGDESNIWASPSGGQFDDPTRWLCGRALSAFDDFIIDATLAGYAPSPFSMAFPGDPEPKQARTLRMRSDIVTLNLAGQSFDLTEGSQGLSRPSLLIGEYPDLAASLTVRNFGSGLPAAGLSGGSLVIGDQPTALPNTQNRLQIQDAGSFLMLSGDAAVGRRGDRGELVLQGQAIGMVDGIISVGTEESAVGEIAVLNAGSEFWHSQPFPSGTGRSMAIGQSGQGTLRIGGSGTQAGAVAASLGRLDTMTLGTNPTGFGTAIIRGAGSSWTLDSRRLRIGLSGDGLIDVRDGGLLDTDTLDDVRIGINSSSNGLVSLSGAGSRWIENRSAIIVGSTGELFVGAGAVVEAPSIQLLPGGRMAGDGQIGSGGLLADVVSLGVVQPQEESGAPGTLTISGDYRQVGPSADGSSERAGTLEVRVGSSGTSDRLIVTGTARLGGGLVVETDGSSRDLSGLELILSAGAIDAGSAQFDVVRSPIVDIDDAGTLTQGTLIPVVSSNRGPGATIELQAITLNELLFGGSEFAPDGAPNDAVLGDVTGDGVDDLVIAVPTLTGAPQGAVALLRGDDTAGFTFTAVDLYLNAAEVDAPTAVEIGDFDNDGTPEIAFASGGDGGGSNDVHIIRFVGVGLADTTMPAFAVAPGSRIVDLAASDGFFAAGGTGLAILEDTPSPGSTVNIALFNTSNPGWDFCPLPVDDDDPDAVDPIDTDGPASGAYTPGVAVTTRGSNRLTVFLAEATDAMPEDWDAVSFPTGVGPRDVRAADLDGDGIDDLVVINQTAGTLSVLRTRGGGDIAPPVEIPASIDPVSLTLVDLDDDGDRDVVIVASNGVNRVVRQLRNTTQAAGSITLAAAQDIPDQPNGTPVLIRSSDLDNSNGPGGVEDDLVILVEPGAARGGGAATHGVRLSRLAEPCPADVNSDGLLTPADFNAWIIAFNTQAPGCDQNGDGLCAPADFNAWILNYNQGCP